MSGRAFPGGGAGGRRGFDSYTGSGDVTGSGTTNTVMLWSNGPGSVAGDSIMTQAGGRISVPALAVDTTNVDTSFTAKGPLTVDTALAADDNGIRFKQANTLQWTIAAKGSGSSYDFSLLNSNTGVEAIYVKNSNNQVCINGATPTGGAVLSLMSPNNNFVTTCDIVGNTGNSGSAVYFRYLAALKWIIQAQYDTVNPSYLALVCSVTSNTLIQLYENSNIDIGGPLGSGVIAFNGDYVQFNRPIRENVTIDTALAATDHSLYFKSAGVSKWTFTAYGSGTTYDFRLRDEAASVDAIAFRTTLRTVVFNGNTPIGQYTFYGRSGANTEITLSGQGVSPGASVQFYDNATPKWYLAGNFPNGNPSTFYVTNVVGSCSLLTFYENNDVQIGKVGGGVGGGTVSINGLAFSCVPAATFTAQVYCQSFLDVTGQIKVGADLWWAASTYIASSATNEIYTYCKRLGIGERAWSSSHPIEQVHVFSSTSSTIIMAESTFTSGYAGFKTKVKTSAKTFYFDQYDTQDYAVLYGDSTIIALNYDGKSAYGGSVTFTEVMNVNGKIILQAGYEIYCTASNNLQLTGGGNLAAATGAALTLRHSAHATRPGAIDFYVGAGVLKGYWKNDGNLWNLKGISIDSATQYDGINIYKGDATTGIIGLKGYGASNDNGALELKNGGTINVFLQANGVSYIKGGNVCIGGTSASYLLTMESSGGGYYSSATHQWHNGSTLSIKTAIVPYTPADIWNKLAALSIVNYKYKTEVTEYGEEAAPVHFGFIADYADPLFSGQNRDSMAMGDCIGFLLAAVKELKAEIEILKAV